MHQLNVEMNRVADRTLSSDVGISYSRFYCLLHVYQSPGATQHDLAVAMGYSDPAISKMVGELGAECLVEVTVDPAHKRRRIVRLTAEGERVVQRCLELLDECFTTAIAQAGVDEAAYAEHTRALLLAMQHKNKENI